jgi:hypothetical protein
MSRSDIGYMWDCKQLRGWCGYVVNNRIRLQHPHQASPHPMLQITVKTRQIIGSHVNLWLIFNILCKLAWNWSLLIIH